MPDFQQISEVIYFFLPFFQSCPFLLIMILCYLLQNTVPAPHARTIPYNVPGQSLPWDLNPPPWLN
jgi:hypothetical protein